MSLQSECHQSVFISYHRYYWRHCFVLKTLCWIRTTWINCCFCRYLSQRLFESLVCLRDELLTFWTSSMVQNRWRWGYFVDWSSSSHKRWQNWGYLSCLLKNWGAFISYQSSIWIHLIFTTPESSFSLLHVHCLMLSWMKDVGMVTSNTSYRYLLLWLWEEPCHTCPRHAQLSSDSDFLGF